MAGLDDVVADHQFTESRRWFSTTLTCACGYEERIGHGMTFPAKRAITQASHWAALLGVPMFRTIDQIRAGK